MVFVNTYPIRSLLFKLDPEQAHDHIKRLTTQIMDIPFAPNILDSLYSFEDPRLKVNLFGKNFKNPVGLAAGFDKNAEMFSFLSHLNFSFIELGTITHEPQPGNPKPRLFRLPKDKALINRFGFNNDGAEATRQRLTQLPSSSTHRVINIGKNKLVDNKNACANYMKTFELLFPFMDMCVVNVSSPNTPGLRQLQEKKSLTELLQTMVYYKKEHGNSALPILVKIAPDLNDHELYDVIEVVKNVGIDGIVATNTTSQRPSTLQSQFKNEIGGLSGKPIQKRSTQVIKFLYKKSDGTIPIIGVGGIFSAVDAYEKIKAGASLVEIYTGLIYEGPSIVKNICTGLVKLLEQDGFKNIQDAVGTTSLPL
jgi:dihydroorotate dehydrogenase